MSTCLIHGYFLRSRHFAKPRLFSREISTVRLNEESTRGQVNDEQLSKSNRPSRRIDHDSGPPPQLNTIKRLAKEMNGCAADLNMARGESE